MPDARTIWLFREKLSRAGAIEVLFARFDQAVRAAGTIPMSGQIIDASLVVAPRQRNTKPMPQPTRRANARKSAVRSCIEHVFAEQKHRMGLFVRTVGMARARVKIGLANLVFNMKRLIWLERTTPA